jgi:hypothetical protein
MDTILQVSQIPIQKAMFFYVSSELGAVSEAKETYLTVCGVPAPETALRLFCSLLQIHV